MPPSNKIESDVREFEERLFEARHEFAHWSMQWAQRIGPDETIAMLISQCVNLKQDSIGALNVSVFLETIAASIRQNA